MTKPSQLAPDTHQHQIDQQVEIACHGFPVDSQPAGELRRVEQAPLHMGQHRPEAMQRGGRNARTKLRYVALQVGADEILPPDQTARIVIRQEALRQAAANPQPAAHIGADFQHIERR
jgi:hypothetical protein